MGVKGPLNEKALSGASAKIPSLYDSGDALNRSDSRRLSQMQKPLCCQYDTWQSMLTILVRLILTGRSFGVGSDDRRPCWKVRKVSFLV